ncbi:MAG: 2-dehydro-3-deoxygalactonokinase, partial [Gemmatimonadaceae bacterium]|nr:2-dehydro-3-deoxygalactonokinase [Acetobacteraceae bacterium]
MIGIDWGTTSLRAYRMDGHTVLERTELPLGITTIAPTRFGPALQQAVGAWLKHGDLRILLSGMIGSRQGWVEAPYLPCPAGLDDLAGSLAPVPWPGLQIMIVPGLSAADESGVPEVMRGEEVQILGTAGLDADCIVCLPGSHSKWVQMAGGRIAGFTTHLTGEAFAALRQHTILAKMIADDAPHDADAFRRGVLRSGEPGGLLHHAFGVRSLGLFGQL